MALTGWFEIYESYSNEELAKEIADLKKASMGAEYTSQTIAGGGGSQAHTRDPKVIEEKLRAALRVQKSRSGGSQGRQAYVGQADFSGGVDGSR
jgi:hypothetical protein